MERLRAAASSLLDCWLFVSKRSPRYASLHQSRAQTVDLFINSIQTPTMMLGPIANKQIGFGFYRPAALIFSNFFSDIPFAAVRVFIFDVIVYFMPDLWVVFLNLACVLPHFTLRPRSAGEFFTFHLFVYLSYLAMQGSFRTFELLCISFDSVFRLAIFFLPNIVQYTGYMIPTFHMKRWLFWIVHFDLFFAEVSSLANRPTWTHCLMHGLEPWRTNSCTLRWSVMVLTLFLEMGPEWPITRQWSHSLVINRD